MVVQRWSSRVLRSSGPPASARMRHSTSTARDVPRTLLAAQKVVLATHGGSESLLGEELQVARRRQWCRQTSQVKADCDYLRRLTSWDFQSLVATEASILGRDDARAPSNDAGRDRESARYALGCPRQRAYRATSSNSSLPLTASLDTFNRSSDSGHGLGFRDFSQFTCLLRLFFH